MRRYEVARGGGPEVLRLVEAPVPEPGPGELRVRTRAIGINFADLAQRAGFYPNQPPHPFTPGLEAAGICDAVGPGVAADLVGKAVMAVPIYGSYAEAFCVEADHAFLQPSWADAAEAAGFPVMFLSAFHALHDLGRARAGERVVVTAAAGGVGTAILQLARAAGVRVLAAVGSPSKHELVRSLGAEEVCHYDDVGAAIDRWGGVDLVLDAIGGTMFRPMWNRIAPSGRYVLYGFSDTSSEKGISYLRAIRGILSMGTLRPFGFVRANRTLAGFNLSLVPDLVPLLRQHMDELLGRWEAGAIRPTIGQRFPFDRLPDAHRLLASRGSTGRIVVEVG
jgi:NADPH:quinone reductase-like Zn-dependent oxidoreductase